MSLDLKLPITIENIRPADTSFSYKNALCQQNPADGSENNPCKIRVVSLPVDLFKGSPNTLLKAITSFVVECPFANECPVSSECSSAKVTPDKFQEGLLDREAALAQFIKKVWRKNIVSRRI